ncbi:hypothetical protein [Azospirillum brasilense]|uniref:hypothetical protein n=1 Tax=Azospirillum brasilense TaxID=192 RepID=UPI0011C4277D|nr:hypothetical protein [Azospirillum brasilense]NUB24636.1 hypothetical protein [Azospirillum brasilense]NUB35185.1 hypothetical protein [Azospirillum brasilense]
MLSGSPFGSGAPAVVGIAEAGIAKPPRKHAVRDANFRSDHGCGGPLLHALVHIHEVNDDLTRGDQMNTPLPVLFRTLSHFGLPQRGTIKPIVFSFRENVKDAMPALTVQGNFAKTEKSKR